MQLTVPPVTGVGMWKQARSHKSLHSGGEHGSSAELPMQNLMVSSQQSLSTGSTSSIAMSFGGFNFSKLEAD